MRRFAVMLLAVISSLTIVASPALTGVSSAIVASSGPAVALLGADYSEAVNDVQAKLLATGRFGSVTPVDVQDATPTLADLEQYSALLLWSNFTFDDPDTLATELVDYVNHGGRLVIATFAWNNNGYGIGDPLVQSGYLPFDLGDQATGGGNLVADEPAHPLLAGVHTFTPGYFREDLSVTAGATQIAHWEDGDPLVAVKSSGGHTVVGLNFNPASSDSEGYGWDASTDGATLLANALTYEGAPPPPPKPPQRGESFVQVSVSPDPVDASGPVTATAAVSPQQAGGTVQFSLDGANVGDPVLLAGASNSASLTLPGPFTAGKHLVGATYSGDAHYIGSFNNYQFTVNPTTSPTPTPTPTGDVVNPTISAIALSGHPKTPAGWYRSPVIVTYHCTEGSAPLDADGCPDPVGVSTDGATTLTRTITATDGGSATDTTTIKLDQTGPDLTVHGVTPGHTYKHPRSITCTATDPTSGLNGPCTVTTHRHHHKIHYKATATDNADNTSKQKGHYTLKH